MSSNPGTVGRPTLEQVAALAGVGRGTASRVINGGEKVSPRARQAVEDAIEQLGYVPNAAARALVKRRTDTVALVIAESEERVFGEPFFAGIVRGIGSALAEADRQLVLLLAQASERRGGLDRYLTRQHVDGVLLLSLHDDDELPDRIRAHGVPVVVGGRPRGEVANGFVDVDNVQGAELAVAHLVERGRERIATIAGPADMVAGSSRFQGYAAGLVAAGRAVDERLVERGDFGQGSGADAMRALLEREPAIDAVFCANDLMAVGALQVLRDAGRRVPEDVAVVGFEDAPIAQSAHPPLTTVHQSPEEMGREMVALLLDTMAAPERDHPGRMLSTRLMVRDSS
jgi:DNA-binding LacI/PurR family transcriptional regulator